MKHPFTCSRLGARRSRGLTLIELMVGVFIAGIILAIGIPSFSSLIVSSRVTSASNELVSALALARSEAVRRGGRVTVCTSADGASCVAAGGWQQGWLVFVDTTRGSVDATVDVGETILSVAPSQLQSLVIQGNAAGASFVSFAADGTSRNMAGVQQTARLRVCTTSGSLGDERRARDIEVLNTGRLSTTTPASVDSTCPAPT